MAKIRVPAMLSVVAVTLCALPLISLAPLGRAGATDDPSPAMNTIADAEGELRVPADYRSMYEYLGSWAIAADQGQGSKQLHSVYASPGAVAAFRTNGHFPDGAVLVKEVYETATSPMTTGRSAVRRLWQAGSSWSKTARTAIRKTNFGVADGLGRGSTRPIP
jgi:Cytochrome P460